MIKLLKSLYLSIKHLKINGFKIKNIPTDMVRRFRFKNTSYYVNILSKYKNIHKNHRCVVIGNGPSLKVEDLVKLKNEYTFAANKIYLSFEETDWRPTYYFVEDFLVAEQNFDKINTLNLPHKFFSGQIVSKVPMFKNSIYFKHLHPGRDHEKVLAKFSCDAIEGLYLGATVVFSMIQMACFMGFNEIYLIGVDFNFDEPDTINKSDKGDYYLHSGEVNHFHKDYRKPGEKWYKPNLERQGRAFQCANDEIKKLNGKILNATRGGKLEVFPRVDFDSIFK